MIEAIRTKPPESCNLCACERWYPHEEWMVCVYDGEFRDIPDTTKRPVWCGRDNMENV